MTATTQLSAAYQRRLLEHLRAGRIRIDAANWAVWVDGGEPLSRAEAEFLFGATR